VLARTFQRLVAARLARDLDLTSTTISEEIAMTCPDCRILERTVTDVRVRLSGLERDLRLLHTAHARQEAIISDRHRQLLAYAMTAGTSGRAAQVH
jgi:hypothetical protein